MGLLTADESLIEAALSEITSLPVDARHQRDPDREVVNLLVDHHLAEASANPRFSHKKLIVFVSHLGRDRALSLYPAGCNSRRTDATARSQQTSSTRFRTGAP